MATRIGERTPIGAFVEVQRGRDALRLIHPMIFADTPATIAPSGTSCVTTAPAATGARSPIVTPADGGVATDRGLRLDARRSADAVAHYKVAQCATRHALRDCSSNYSGNGVCTYQ